MTTHTLDQIQQPANGISQATAVEQARAVAEVAAAVRVARDFPRNEDQARERMVRACSTQALADRAFYSLPRAGGRVEGMTVHIAREIAACWGNVDYGIREMRRDDAAGVSEMQAWAWDQETNVRSSRSFVVPHAIMSGKGADKRRKPLTDLGDIANNNNSVAARAVRETIFTILPIWYVTEAENIANAVLRGEHPSQQQKPADAAEQVINGFADFGVTLAMLEGYVALPRDEWTPQTIGALRVLGGEINRGEKKVEDEFHVESEAKKPQTVAELAGGPTDA
jgi:hypothetical protein